MSFVEIYYGIQVMAFLIFVSLMAALLLFIGAMILIGKFQTWRKSGYCRHKWKLYNTHSVGAKADYKCMHCGEKRTM